MYLEKYKNTPTGSRRISKSICSSDSRISDIFRFDKTDHLVQNTEEKKEDAPEKIATQLYEQCVQNVLLGYVLIVSNLFIANNLYLETILRL